MVKLTVFTPTYNRAYTLHKCYKSLTKQTCKEFRWLIIDDGSTDNTKELVQNWIKERLVNITYYYQKNQGMHGAHNRAYELIDTELNVCIDSDDYMPNDAIEKILDFWNKNKSDDVIGIAALDCYESGQIIGMEFPDGLKKSTYLNIYHKHKIKGDKKFIYKTDVIKDNPYPIFKGENYVGLAYKYSKINKPFLLMNECVCVVEYMDDGSSRNMFKQYKKNPQGFAFLRIENMKNPNMNLIFKFKESIHYVSSSIILKNKRFLKESPCKLITFLAIPFGVLLSAYINIKTLDYT